MRKNQYTSTDAKRNLNVRLTDELRTRIKHAARELTRLRKISTTQADIVREALERYLPELEAQFIERQGPGHESTSKSTDADRR